jgi:microcystin-dependent protein
MKLHRISTGMVLLAAMSMIIPMHQTWAQESSAPDPLNDLKREVAELRSVVNSIAQRSVTQEDATSKLSQYSPLVGTVLAYAGEWPPAGTTLEAWEKKSGWMLCNGRLIPTIIYQELHEVVGKTYGAEGEGFRLPDFRGLFLRGTDLGKGTDPDSSSRSSANPSAPSPTKLGTFQADAIIHHTHNVNVSGDTSTNGAHHHDIERTKGHQTIRWGDDGGTSSAYIDQGHRIAEGADGAIRARLNGDHAHTFSGTGSTGNTIVNSVVTNAAETRPKNAAVHWIIKYRSNIFSTAP